MSRASSLHRLQTLDTELHRKRASLREIELVLSDSGATTRTRQALVEAETRLEGARGAVRSAEAALAAHRAKIEQTEGSLYGGGVRNPKELQDLQNEAESLQRFRPTLEDRVLEAMLGLEEAEIQRNSAQQELARVQGLEVTRNEALIQKREETQAEIERLESEREAALGDVAPADLELYQQLRANHGGLAVALLEEESCGACGLLPHPEEHGHRQTSGDCRCCGIGGEAAPGEQGRACCPGGGTGA